MIFHSQSYLTIDDSPSERMDGLVDYLFSRGIPAMFFCRGDKLEQYASSAIKAIEKGFVLANHAYSHQRSSQKTYDWVVDEIIRTQDLIDGAYKAAGVKGQGKFFRFPQLDRGTAGWIVDYDAYDADQKKDLLETFAQGLNVQSMERPSLGDFDKKDKLQAFLKDQGFIQPFKGVTKPWYHSPEIASASDCLYTFSNCDWMLTQRHLGKWPYKSVQDLKDKARRDESLTSAGQVNVILAHDQAEILDVTIELIEDLFKGGMKFLPVS